MLECRAEGASKYLATAPVLSNVVSCLSYPRRSIPTLRSLGFRGSGKRQKCNHFPLHHQPGPW